MSVLLTERQRIEQQWHDEKFRAGAVVHDDRQVDRAAQCLWDLVGRPVGLTILDFGCGEGWLSVNLAKQGNRLHGFDLSGALIARARQLAESEQVADRTTFTEMAAENLDYPEASFDLVIGTSILHHTDLEVTLTRIRHVLKPDGRAIFLEPLNQNIALKLWRLVTPWRRTSTERAFTGDDIAAVRRHFPATRFSYFCFASMFTAGLLILRPRSRAARVLNGWLEELDTALLRAFPSLGRFSAVAVMDMRK